MQIVHASSPEPIKEVRRLFLEYVATLGEHLCLTGFEKELASLPGAYAPPGGTLLLASVDGTAAGCVAVRPLEGREGVGEVKRLYVRPAFRGRNIGVALVASLIDEARRIGYRRLWLDTLPRMTAAHRVYTGLGFARVPNLNPKSDEEIWCFELDLSAASRSGDEHPPVC